MFDKNYMNHEFKSSHNRYETDNIYICLKCNLEIRYSTTYNVQYIARWDFSEGRYLNKILTCDEVIIKNILE